MPVRGDPGFVRLYKLRPLLDALKTRFKQQYSPHYIQAINEATIVYNRGTSLKQHMGKGKGLGYKVVTTQCEDLLKKNFWLFLDSFYSCSPHGRQTFY